MFKTIQTNKINNRSTTKKNNRNCISSKLSDPKLCSKYLSLKSNSILPITNFKTISFSIKFNHSSKNKLTHKFLIQLIISLPKSSIRPIVKLSIKISIIKYRCISRGCKIKTKEKEPQFQEN